MDQLLILGAAMLATGCVAGVLAGLFGIGGGIVIVPVLELTLGFVGVDPAIRMHIAVATSLAIIIPTSLSSARAHAQRQAVDFALVKRWAFFVFAGALLGAWIAAQVHSRVLASIFAIVAVLVAAKMLFLTESRNLTDDVPRGPLVFTIPAAIGCLSSMMGIGGGTFSVMTLTIFNQPIHRAVGTAALLGLVISLPGTIGFIITGWSDTRLPPGSLGYVNLLGFALIAPATVLTAPLGAKIAHSFSAKKLSMLFGAFLLIAAGRLFYGAWDIGPKELQSDDASECAQCEDWNLPMDPFRIYGNTWFVGTDGLSSILIETNAGLILIDGGLPQSAARIEANIEKLGFDVRDISAILLSHAHFDHAGGIAALQRLSGANVFASNAAAESLATGALQEGDPQYMNAFMPVSFPAVLDVTVVGDVEVVSIGDVDIFSVLTPGHTPGGVTWTWQTCVLDTCYDIVYADSLSAVSAEGFKFSDGPAAIDLRTSAEIISSLDCDIFLSPHTFLFGMHEKLERRDAGNPFVNNVGCMMYAESSLARLEERLHAESGQLPSFE